MRTHGWQNTKQMGDALKEKWTHIQKSESAAKNKGNAPLNASVDNPVPVTV
jgi:hypothetical protein